MVNFLGWYMSMLHKTVKLSGMQPKAVEIEPGTVVNFWVPSKPSEKPKPILVLVHGFAADGILTWQFQVLSSSLRKKYDLYVPDLLFFGGSYTSRGERSTRFQADCIAAGLRRLGVERCIVVGFSYGGFVGFQMAQHHSDLVGSMVVSGSTLALTQSISSKALERLGFASWSELLLPTSAQGVKVLVEHGSYKLHKLIPRYLCKDFLEVFPLFSF
uniref:AB hydrolase-1 domain-containing protein n=1 Tax=Opuntia streptacantha TaxID=393608 RepID=A0A7C9CZF8_OPUST